MGGAMGKPTRPSDLTLSYIISIFELLLVYHPTFQQIILMLSEVSFSTDMFAVSQKQTH